MLMKFKEGDRVHVTRFNREDVNFFATLGHDINSTDMYRLIDCSIHNFTNGLVWKQHVYDFGENKQDYYVLAEDEEDTEAPVVQRVEDIKRYITDAKEYIESAFKAAEKSKYDFNQSKENTTDPVNHPDHYNYGEIEIIDFIEQVTQHYNSDVAYHIGNAIKYLARSPHKNGKEDIEKARWYIERAYQKWSD